MLLNYCIVVFFLLLIMFFPGILIIRYLQNFNLLNKVILTVSVSFSFWICFAWFIFMVKLPLDLSAIVLLFIFSITSLVLYRQPFKSFRFSSFFSKFKRAHLVYVILLIAVVLYLFPLTFMAIPPGGDASMHGYITRLLLENNGIPSTYDPIIPNQYFGSYSAGYHTLTALVCAVNDHFLREGINLITLSVYAFGLLSFVFLYSQFISVSSAVLCGVIIFSINNTLQPTIGWGGNPTILAFGLCLVSIGLLVNAIKNSNRFIFLITAIIISAIPLTHAIPAIIFIYLCIPGFFLIVFFNRDKWKWILINSSIMAIISIALLLPFLAHFKNENYSELSEMIKNWQIQMMGNNHADTLSGNLVIVFEQIKYRIGDPFLIISTLSLLGLFYFKKFKQISLVVFFFAYISLLILNCYYWVLPLSELLYPERTVFFVIPCLGFLFGILIDNMTKKEKLLVNLKYVLISMFMMVGCVRYWNGYFQYLTEKNNLVCDKKTMEAFDWIKSNTATDALLKCTYMDIGMWIPAFSDRATIGAHFHFIHIVNHARELLEKSDKQKYYFVSMKDLAEKTEITKEISDKKLVFSNERVSIYH